MILTCHIDKQRLENLLDFACAGEQPIQIIGLPGSGKTCLLQWLAKNIKTAEDTRPLLIDARSISEKKLEVQIQKATLSGNAALIDNAETLPQFLLDKILEITASHIPPVMASRRLLRAKFTNGTPGVVFRLKELSSRQSTLFASEYIKALGEKTGTDEWECSTEFIAETALHNPALIAAIIQLLAEKNQTLTEILKTDGNFNAIKKDMHRELIPEDFYHSYLYEISILKGTIPLAKWKKFHSEEPEFTLILQQLMDHCLVEAIDNRRLKLPETVRYLLTKPPEEQLKNLRQKWFELLHNDQDCGSKLEAFYLLQADDSQKALDYLQGFSLQETGFMPEVFLNIIENIPPPEKKHHRLLLLQSSACFYSRRFRDALKPLSLVPTAEIKKICTETEILFLTELQETCKNIMQAEITLKNIKEKPELSLKPDLLYCIRKNPPIKLPPNIKEQLSEIADKNTQNDKKSIPILIEAYRLCLRYQMPQEAEKLSHRLLGLKADPAKHDSLMLLQWQSRILIQRRDFESAEKIIEKLSSMNLWQPGTTNDINTLILSGHCFYMQGDNHNALNQYLNALNCGLQKIKHCSTTQKALLFALKTAIETEQTALSDELSEIGNSCFLNPQEPGNYINFALLNAEKSALKDNPGGMEYWIEEMSSCRQSLEPSDISKQFFAGFLYRKIINPWECAPFDYPLPTSDDPLEKLLTERHFSAMEKLFNCCINRNGIWQMGTAATIRKLKQNPGEYELFFDYTSSYYIEKKQGLLALEKSRTLLQLFLILAFKHGQNYSLKQLFEAVWQKEFNPEDDAAVRMAVNRLKKKIETEPNSYIGVYYTDGSYYLKPGMKYCIIIPAEEMSCLRNTVTSVISLNHPALKSQK
jgi:hypothetical protein